MSNLTNLISVPDIINDGLNGTNNTFMLSLLGSPSDNYSKNCSNPTNPKFLENIVWGKNVGPFNVSGYKLAVESLIDIMKDIKKEQQDVYDVLSTAGMLCCRYVRGSRSSISNHSWGTAIDLKIENVLDRRGNDKVQIGLSLIAPIFHKHGWYWGAGFPIEDAMHFEVSKQKVNDWHDSGKIQTQGVKPAELVVTFGDRNDDVKKLQLLLNLFGHNLSVDGVFGPATRAAIVSFQSVNGLVPDGIVGPKTLAKLKALT